MARPSRRREEWGPSYRNVPDWAHHASALVAHCLPAPEIPRCTPAPDYASMRDAACGDLQRRFADPLRVVEVQGVRIVSVLDALVFAHNLQSRRIHAGAWRPDGTVEFNFLNRIEIGRPFAGFAWLDVVLSQWCVLWPGFATVVGAAQMGGRMRNALKRWIREHINMQVQRQAFGAALKLEPRVVWMAERLERRRRHGWLFADRYNAVGRHFQQLEWALAGSPPLFRLVGSALLDGQLVDPNEPVAATLRHLRTLGVSAAAWKTARRLGPRVFDLAIDRARNGRLFEVCVEVLRLLEITDLQPPPDRLQQVLYSQHNLRGTDRVRFERGWCRYPDWFLRSAARAARDAKNRAALESFVADEYLPAVEWLVDARPRPDSNQKHAGWPWIRRAVTTWLNDPGPTWTGSTQAWHSAIESGFFGGYHVFALRDPQALIEEGVAMRHCVADYIEECALGRARVFSLRDPNSGERVATAMLRRGAEGHWSLSELRERRNRAPTDSMQNAARWLCFRYSEKMARLSATT